MSTKICLKCESRGGMNFMKSKVVAPYDPVAHTPEELKWTCPYCGYTEDEIISHEAQGGTYNSGIVQGPLKADDEVEEEGI